MEERNPFNITTPEGMPTREAVDLFVDVLSDFPKVKRQGHIFLHGARGTGKSMIFRFLMPDCQSVAQKKKLTELDFLSVYVPIKLTDLNLSELMRVDGKHASTILNEHFMCVFFAERLCSNLVSLCKDQQIYPWEDTEDENYEALKTFVESMFSGLLQDAGEVGVLPIELEGLKTGLDCCQLMTAKCRQMRVKFARYLRSIAFSSEVFPYEGGLCSYLDFFLPLAASLRTLPFIPDTPVYLLVDDADNLSLEQTKILNSWVSYRSTKDVSIKISTQLKYKTFYTAEGYTIDAPHDYSEINISTIYTRGDYQKRMEQIIQRRLNLFGLEDLTPQEFFPPDSGQEQGLNEVKEQIRMSFDTEGRGHRVSDDVTRYTTSEYMKSLGGKSKSKPSYSYSGFSQLVDISSGIVRNFLEPASIMFSEVVSAKEGDEGVRFIPPGVQNHSIRRVSSMFFFETFEKLQYDKSDVAPCAKNLTDLQSAIAFLGGLFHLQLLSNWAERRVFSFAFSDEPSSHLQEVLKLGVELGFFHLSFIGNKDGTGRTSLYVMSRMLAPHFNLDPTSFAGYKFLTSSALESAIANPDRALRSIKSHGFEILDDKQLELPIFAGANNV